MDNTRVPRKLISSWTTHPRKSGHPQITFRNTFAQALNAILPGSVDPKIAINKTWMPRLQDEEWDDYLEMWWDQKTPRARSSDMPPLPPITPPRRNVRACNAQTEQATPWKMTVGIFSKYTNKHSFHNFQKHGPWGHMPNTAMPDMQPQWMS